MSLGPLHQRLAFVGDSVRSAWATCRLEQLWFSRLVVLQSVSVCVRLGDMVSRHAVVERGHCRDASISLASHLTDDELRDPLAGHAGVLGPAGNSGAGAGRSATQAGADAHAGTAQQGDGRAPGRNAGVGACRARCSAEASCYSQQAGQRGDGGDWHFALVYGHQRSRRTQRRSRPSPRNLPHGRWDPVRTPSL